MIHSYDPVVVLSLHGILVRKRTVLGDSVWTNRTQFSTVKDKLSIPIIDDLLDQLYGATIFSKIDFRAGYHQIRVKGRKYPQTAFKTLVPL